MLRAVAAFSTKHHCGNVIIAGESASLSPSPSPSRQGDLNSQPHIQYPLGEVPEQVDHLVYRPVVFVIRGSMDVT